MLTEEHKKKIKYLNSYRYLDKEVDRKIKELETWRSKIFNVTGTMTDMPKNPNRSNTIEEGIAAIDDIESNINSDIDELVSLRRELESKINTVKDLQLRELLKCRYLDFKYFEEIAYRGSCSIRHIYRLHEKALDQLKI